MATKKTTGETKSAAQIRYEATHMPELEQREVLRNLHFTDTGLNPSDADYEMKVLVLTAYLQNKNKEGGHDDQVKSRGVVQPVQNIFEQVVSSS
ncbi:MAG: hypothetical protein EZS28_006607, partial [Streblomastix strix]